jgi:hypothetical protein
VFWMTVRPRSPLNLIGQQEAWFMSAIDVLKTLLHWRAPTPRPSSELIYVYLPEDLDPWDRVARYADVLEVELQLGGLGWATAAVQC